MPKFGTIWFNGYYFGKDTPVYTSYKHSIHRIELGMSVRGTIGKIRIGGTLHKVLHTVGGVTRQSTYYTGETYDTSKAIIFMVFRGHGYGGSVKGKLYQIKKRWQDMPAKNNPEGQAARDAFAQAVLNWQTVLSEAAKIEYNKRASKGLHMSGYNLYIREYVRANA